VSIVLVVLVDKKILRTRLRRNFGIFFVSVFFVMVLFCGNVEWLSKKKSKSLSHALFARAIWLVFMNSKMRLLCSTRNDMKKIFLDYFTAM
jgi:hypothetical protein